jgi:hypothetical protein
LCCHVCLRGLSCPLVRLGNKLSFYLFASQVRGWPTTDFLVWPLIQLACPRRFLVGASMVGGIESSSTPSCKIRRLPDIEKYFVPFTLIAETYQ